MLRKNRLQAGVENVSFCRHLCSNEPKMSASCSVHSGASKEYRELMKGGLGNGFHFTNRNKPVWKYWGEIVMGFLAMGFLGRVVQAAAKKKKKITWRNVFQKFRL